MNSIEGETEESWDQSHLNQLASVGQIAAGIAHEVKNPLTAVKGFLQLLQKEEKNEYLDIAQSELENALTTLQNLLQISKPDLENEEYQQIYLSVELESILNLFQDKLYNITTITEFNDVDIPVVGKKNQFKKAFFNLIKNGIESIEGEGTLTITHDLVDDEVIVTIKDTGVGIPSDKLSLLGTPFFSTKSQGTGMGLTQVFSVVYEHGGKIYVDSKEKKGTKFTIQLPQQQMLQTRQKEMRIMQLQYEEHYSIKDFFFHNRLAFEERLLAEAINVKDKIKEIHSIGNINLLNNAHKLVLFVVEKREHELISFAKQEGISWAKFSLTLAFKLEWIQAIRRTLWDFLYNFDQLNQTEFDRTKFYKMEKNINEMVDQFLTYFFISYSKYKDDLLEEQRRLVENISVPIIPINREICILPLIGTIDQQRVSTIFEKVLDEIGDNHIQTLIIDLSGIAPLEQEAASEFIRIIDGLYMMGCKAILTGLRSDIVKSLISIGLDLNKKIEFKGTLQSALNDVFFYCQKQ